MWNNLLSRATLNDKTMAMLGVQKWKENIIGCIELSVETIQSFYVEYKAQKVSLKIMLAAS